MSEPITGGPGLYLRRQADSLFRYTLEQGLQALLGWVPALPGIAMRALAYRAIVRMDGWAAIEHGVRLCFANHIRLGHRAYLDRGVYIHACPGGVEIGPGTLVMYGAVLHVYNFRDLPHAGIRIGRDCLVGEYCVIRGPGGVTIGDRVYLSPGVHIYSSNHIFSDPERPFIEQGVTTEGVTIEDECWIGANSVILDGVTIGRRSVVAAGAVVTQSVPPHVLVAGVPARVVRDLRRRGDEE
jgi:acetyltransferase-like isoleucine patch superfamily enzyme